MSKLEHLPSFDAGNETQVSALFPSRYVAGIAETAIGAIDNLMADMEPGRNPDPHFIAVGWDSEKPSIQVAKLTALEMTPALASTIGMRIQQSILEHRRKGSETLAVGLVYCRQMDPPKVPSPIHTLERRIEGAEKGEFICIEVIWQDGRAVLMSDLRAMGWHDATACFAESKAPYFDAIAPALCPPAYGEAIMMQFGGSPDA
jgi:hypothetical protein